MTPDTYVFLAAVACYVASTVLGVVAAVAIGLVASFLFFWRSM